MLPGKTATKKRATTQPTAVRHRDSATRAIASPISMTPDMATTADADGIHVGTWARNSVAATK